MKFVGIGQCLPTEYSLSSVRKCAKVDALAGMNLFSMESSRGKGFYAMPSSVMEPALAPATELRLLVSFLRLLHAR